MLHSPPGMEQFIRDHAVLVRNAHLVNSHASQLKALYAVHDSAALEEASGFCTGFPESPLAEHGTRPPAHLAVVDNMSRPWFWVITATGSMSLATFQGLFSGVAPDGLGAIGYDTTGVGLIAFPRNGDVLSRQAVVAVVRGSDGPHDSLIVTPLPEAAVGTLFRGFSFNDLPAVHATIQLAVKRKLPGHELYGRLQLYHKYTTDRGAHLLLPVLPVRVLYGMVIAALSGDAAAILRAPVDSVRRFAGRVAQAKASCGRASVVALGGDENENEGDEQSSGDACDSDGGDSSSDSSSVVIDVKPRNSRVTLKRRGAAGSRPARKRLGQ